MKKHLVVILVSLLTYNLSEAQEFLGIRQMNYSGVMGSDLNPASLADNRMVVDVTLAGFSFNAYNNYLHMNTRLMPYGWQGSFSSDTNDLAAQQWQNDPNFGKIIFADSTDYYRSINSGNFFTFDNPDRKPLKALINTEVDILNAMATFRKNTMGVSFQIKHRTFLNVDHISPDLMTLIVEELEYPDLWNLDLKDQLLNLSFNSWVEYNAGFAMVLKDDNEHFFKAGGKLKFLQGLASLYLYTDEVDYNFLNADTATFLKGDFDYGYSSNIDDYFDANATSSTNSVGFNDVFQLTSKLGLGLDIGGVYEWRPNWKDYKYDMDGKTDLWRRDQNKYKLRVGFAINDIGGMKYTKSVNSRNFEVNTQKPLELATFEDTDGLIGFNENVDSLILAGSAQRIDDKGVFVMNLPTHFNLDVDYHIWNDFYANFRLTASPQRNKDAHKVRYPTSIALTPRYDYKWAGAAIPLSYSSLYGMRAGLGLRLGPIVIGTGDLKPFFAPGKDRKVRGADFYFALKVPILYGKPNDKDLDKVSKKYDKCPNVPGVWEFKGCPDSDGDGIKDIDDACPTDPGPKEFDGCPDTDGDKIIDLDDDCPEDAGLAEFNGCPDTDGDKIMDKDDECPEVPGLVEFKGCPDTDGDGITDADDLCPEVPGPIENEGCPDTDGDGLLDYLDGCPTEAGPRENNGCPWVDTDGDGLLDKDDKCPTVAGPIENEGCPYTDTDGDGVIDKDDECITVPGPVENKGCPVIKEEEQEILNTAFENLEFESGKAIIKQVSYASLEELAGLLIKKSDWKLQIAGHTDDVGKAQSNLILSKKRSEAVRDFLVQRGIATERFVVQYFGEEKPIATNDTPAGRQKNRRVEMTVIFE